MWVVMQRLRPGRCSNSNSQREFIESRCRERGFANVQVITADMNDFAAMNAVYAARFGSHTPARSTVQVARLPRDVKVEIEVVARLA